jgi:large subunit ribosomal protein L18
MAKPTNPRKVMRLKRKSRIRKRLHGTAERPRLSVFRSARHIYAQIIDDLQGVTLVAAGTLSPEIKDKLAGPEKDPGRPGGGETPGRQGQGKGHRPGGLRPQRLSVSRPGEKPGGELPGAWAGVLAVSYEL